MKKNKKIIVIDGQGGKLGGQIISVLKEKAVNAEIIALGTNSIASANMIKAGPSYAATGENAVKVACRTADIIVGPIGIVIADAFHGEISPAMALAVAQADAERILIPVNRCSNYVAGLRFQNVSDLLEDAVQKILDILTDC